MSREQLTDLCFAAGAGNVVFFAVCNLILLVKILLNSKVNSSSNACNRSDDSYNLEDLFNTLHYGDLQNNKFYKKIIS